MPQVIQFLPVECLDALVAATGFDLAETSYDYKFTWLVERIGMLRKDSEAAAIVHDNPQVSDLVAVIQEERAWSAGQQNTINAMTVELEKLRGRK